MIMPAEKKQPATRIQKKSTGKRKFHTKSRKGCATCKRRRVKCDECKPICGNCDRMGIECVYIPLDQQQQHLKQSKKKSISRRQSDPQVQPQVQMPSKYPPPVSIKDQIAAALSSADIPSLPQLLSAGSGLSPELLNVASSINLEADSCLPQLLDHLKQSGN
ncbi:unnamed protein product [Ambrosiozyma monospora]|uniref:Unnamed protein product n=1 Tax=Ambrosiozyma monospora TaxID=43982 RepID=A0A9W6Z054_AMBMO|nr:unnamed protein product [Ambrosiozyma monospora]